MSFKLIAKQSCLAGCDSGRPAKPAGLLSGIVKRCRVADVTTIFTESLILAQDERWRRA